MTQAFDLVLRGGRVIDPAKGIDAICDGAVAKGRIAAVQPGLPKSGTSIDVRGALILPGTACAAAAASTPTHRYCRWQRQRDQRSLTSGRPSSRRMSLMICSTRSR
jgi:hypothetical protein